MSVKHIFHGHTGSIKGMAFVNENRYLVTGGSDKKIIMFDMKIDSIPYYFELFDAEVR